MELELGTHLCRSLERSELYGVEVEKGAEVVRSMVARARAWQWGEECMQGRARLHEDIEESIDREERGILRMLWCGCWWSF